MRTHVPSRTLFLVALFYLHHSGKHQKLMLYKELCSDLQVHRDVDVDKTDHGQLYNADHPVVPRVYYV